jgi:hypothetical protein
MCGHVFLYQDRYHPCSTDQYGSGTCGRVACPLDCPGQRLRQHLAVLAQRLGQWVSGFDAGRQQDASAVALAASPTNSAGIPGPREA